MAEIIHGENNKKLSEEILLNGPIANPPSINMENYYDDYEPLPILKGQSGFTKTKKIYTKTK